MGLVERLLFDLSTAEARGASLQEFATSIGLSPAMMRALRKGRSELGEDSIGKLLAVTSTQYEREAVAYLRERGNRLLALPARQRAFRGSRRVA